LPPILDPVSVGGERRESAIAVMRSLAITALFYAGWHDDSPWLVLRNCRYLLSLGTALGFR
jgi:hypothetical protein